METISRLTAYAAMIFCGAIFGFFFAYFVSAINGLDTLPEKAAIEAMNAINREVRNVRFFPAFFLTPIVCLAAGAAAWATGRRKSAGWFWAAAFVYVAGGMGPTILANVPLNRTLLEVDPATLSQAAAAAIWADYSGDWQFWNGVRMVLSGAALLCAGAGLAARGYRNASPTP